MKIVLLVVFVGFAACQVVIKTKRDCSVLPEIEEENCCESPNVTDEEIETVCEQEAVAKRLKPPTKDCYVTQCYYKNLGFVEGEKVSASKMKSYITTHPLFPDNNWKNLFKGAIPACVERAYQMEGRVRESFSQALEIDQKICNPIYDYITACIVMDVFMKCPANAWTDSPNCRQLKEFVHECPDFLLTAKN